MAIQGLRSAGVAGGDGTLKGFIEGQRPLDWRTAMLLLFPNGNMPLTALTSMMKKRTTVDPEFNWWEKELETQRFVLNAAISNVDTVIALVSGGTQVRVNHVIRFEETGELVRVVTHPSDISITVERGFAGTTNLAIDPAVAGTNPNMQVVGSAFEEGSGKPEPISFDPVKRVSYTQIFRWNIGATRTAMKTRLRTGDAVREAKREALQYHGIEMERAFIYGFPSESSLNGYPHRTTGGALYFIGGTAGDGVGGAGVERVVDYAGAATDLETIETNLEQLFRFGSSEKLAMCGNLFLLTLQQIIRKNATYELIQGQREFGMNVSRLVSPFGEVVFKTHPLLNQQTSGTTGGTAYQAADSWAIFLDMENVTYRPLTDSDTKWMPDQQDNGQDGMEAGYLTEAGMEFAQAKTHGWWKGLTTPATDTP